jgi:tetratricopeptide (TPR) repeat protein
VYLERIEAAVWELWRAAETADFKPGRVMDLLLAGKRVARSKNDPETAYWLGQALLRERLGGGLGREDAIRMLQLARKHDRHLDRRCRRAATIALALARLHLEARHPAPAITEAKHALHLRCLHPEAGVLPLLGDAYMLNGDAGAAVALFLKDEPRFQRRAEHLWTLAVALDRNGDAGEALRISAEALQLDADLSRLMGVEHVPVAEVHYYLGLANLARGRLLAAKAAFDRFVQMSPNSKWRPRAEAHLKQLVSETR